MASHNQYEYFKFKYKEEDDRNSILTKRAEIYLSLIALLLTGLIFKIADIKTYISSDKFLQIIFVLLLVHLLGAVGFTILSIKLRDYQSDMEVGDYIEELGASEPEDKEFFDNRIASFINATKENFEINNEKADKLQMTGFFLSLSFIYLFVFILIIITI